MAKECQRMNCPKCCRFVEVDEQPKRGHRDDYRCPSCALAFSVSSSDRPATRAGADTFLSGPDRNGRIWLRPVFAGWWPPHDMTDVVAWRFSRSATPYWPYVNPLKADSEYPDSRRARTRFDRPV
jgi:hypothetical protein